MSNGVPVQVCAGCGRRFFPHRLSCPCGSREFSIVVIEEGVVEERTTVRRAPGRSLDEAVAIATVVLRDGPPVVARVGSDTQPGDAVRLRLEAAAPVAATT